MMLLLSNGLDISSREQSARHIFGVSSERVVEVYGDSPSYIGVALSEEMLYQILVVVMMVFYIAWIYRFINVKGFRNFVSVGSAFSHIRNWGVHTGSSRRRLGDFLLLWSLIMGLFMLFVTKVMEVGDGVLFDYTGGAYSISNEIMSLGMDRWMLVVVGGFLLSMLWSFVVLYVADRLSRSGTIFRSILELRSQTLLHSVVYLMPCILLCAFGAYGSVRFSLALLMVLGFTLWYLIRSFLLFQSKKISILLWISYLCAVEILPATLVWAIFTRN